jgi:outer membrane cobalamin receptor
VLGDPTLEPEASWNATAEAGLRTGPMHWYVRGFHNDIRNLIDTELTGDTTNAGIDIYAYQNVDRTRTAGLETGGMLSRGILELTGSVAFLETEDLATGRELLGRARLSGRGALTVSPGRYSFRAELHRQGRVPRSRAAAGTVYQTALTRLNLSGTASIGQFRLAAGVDNVLDDIPENALMQTGRRWFVSLTTGVSL